MNPQGSTPQVGGDLPPVPSDLVIETSVAPVNTIGSINNPADVAPNTNDSITTTTEPMVATDIPAVPATTEAPTTIASVGSSKELPETGTGHVAGMGGIALAATITGAAVQGFLRKHPRKAHENK